MLGNQNVIGVATAVLLIDGPLAAIGPSAAAGQADAAFDDEISHDGLAYGQMLDLLAESGHITGAFVAHDPRKGYRGGFA